MKNKLRYALVTLLLLQIPVAFTQPQIITTGPSTQIIPEGCNNEGFIFQNGQLILGAQNDAVNYPSQNGYSNTTPRNGSFSSGLPHTNPAPKSSFNGLYLIRNISEFQQLLLSHPTNTAMSAGWESRLDRGQWSAITISRPNFVVNCFGRRPGAIGYVDCGSVLQVCAYSNLRAGEGGYWASENKSLSETIGTLKSRNLVEIPKALSDQN